MPFLLDLLFAQKISRKVLTKVKPSTHPLLLYFFHLHTMLQIHLIKSSVLQKQFFNGITWELNISKLTESDCKVPGSMGIAEHTSPKHKDSEERVRIY